MNATSKWLIAFLFISLAVNIFIVGYFIGHTPNKSDQVVSSALGNEMKGIFKDIPLENRKQLGDMIKQQQLQILANQQKMKDLRLAMANVLVQEPLDKPKLGLLFEKMAEYSSQNVALSQQTLFQTFIQLSLADRIKVAKVLAASAVPQKKVTNPTDKSS